MAADDRIEIRVPAKVKLALRNDAAGRGRPIGRHLLDCWLKTLPREAQKAIRTELKAPKSLPEESEHPECPNCGVSHVRMPTRGPWHDGNCADWRQRGCN